MKEKKNPNIENENKTTEKKEKKKWSKKKKAGVTCLVIVLLAAITAFNFFIVVPTMHISLKYGISATELKMKKIILPHLNLESNVSPDDNINWISDLCFKYNYNDEEFFVVYYNGSYYDDYQLEEIAKWTTDFFQQKVDSNFVAVEIYGDGLVLDPPKTTLLRESIYNENWESYFFEKEKYTSLTLFYYVDDLNDVNENKKDYLKDKITNEMKVTLNNDLIYSKKYRVYLINDRSGFSRKNSFGYDQYQNKIQTYNSYYGIDINELYSYDKNLYFDIFL